jgi:hypothetical protein
MIGHLPLPHPTHIQHLLYDTPVTLVTLVTFITLSLLDSHICETPETVETLDTLNRDLITCTIIQTLTFPTYLDKNLHHRVLYKQRFMKLLFI